MHHINIDIETRSDVDIGKAGVYRYVQSETFAVLLIAYSVDGGRVKVIDVTKGEDESEVRCLLTDPGYRKHAFNAEFEWVCLRKHTGLPLDPAQWRDTMLHAAYCGYAGSLQSVGAAMGLPEDQKKLSTGRALIRLFCTPHKHTTKDTRDWIQPADEPEKWNLFKEYNRQDVIAERTIWERLATCQVPEMVEIQWRQNLLMNARGVCVDTQLVEGAIRAGDTAAQPLREEAQKLTGLENPNSPVQLKKYLTAQGCTVTTLRQEDLDTLLADATLPAKVKRVLAIRKELGKSSIKKYESARNVVCKDGRAHGLLSFYGARTGRYAGRLIQVQNLPRTYLHGDVLDTARNLARRADYRGLQMVFGSVSDTLSQLIRTILIPTPGNKFIDADFSSIEARVLAWLAGESWSLEVFRTHGKIYEAQASQMFGVPLEKIRKGNPEYALRQKGKVAVLALGYQGGVGALISMGALNMGIPEEDLQGIVQLWRRTNRRCVALWKAVERCAKETIRTGRQTAAGKVLFTREIDTHNDFLTIQLPSGRKLFYVRPAVEQDRITFWGQNQTTRKWSKQETYGGKLVENIVQAVARDCLVEKLLQLEAAGYNIVFHIHDEVIIDARQDQHLADVVEIMKKPVSWAPDLPLNADGWEGEYFTKD